MEHISDDAKRLAKAIYLKKKMYYNMRMKTLKRDATNIIAKAQEMHLTKMKAFDDSIRTLLRLQKDMESFVESQQSTSNEEDGAVDAASGDEVPDEGNTDTAEAENEDAPAVIGGGADASSAVAADATVDDGDDPNDAPQWEGADQASRGVGDGLLEGDSAMVVNAIDTLQGHISAIEQLLEILRQRILEISVFSTSRVMVEFDTGGNVRLEEGKPSDLWFRSCAELVNSRFLAHDFTGLSISGIRVNRVIRVHNRYLRSRFDKHMQKFADKKERKDDSGEGSKRTFEYLFYGESPALAQKTGCRNELLRVAEEGFRQPDEYKRHGFDGSIRLSSCIFGADCDRIESIQPKGEPLSLGRALTRSHGQVVITKAFLGNHREMSARDGRANSSADGDSDGGGADDVSSRNLVHASDFPDMDSIFQLRGANPKDKNWYVFDDALLLPEYIVSFQYLSDEDAHSQSPTSNLQKDIVEFGGIGGKDVLSEQELLDYTPFLLPLIYFLRQVDTSCIAHGREFGDLYDRAKAVANKMPERPKLLHITEGAALASANADSLAEVAHLNLHGLAIRKIEKIAACTNLHTLVLSSNEIHRIEGLGTLHKLEHLDLSFNLLKRIGSLSGLQSLAALNLGNNLLNKLEDVNLIRRHVPGLLYLDLRGNVICKVVVMTRFSVRSPPFALRLLSVRTPPPPPPPSSQARKYRLKTEREFPVLPIPPPKIK